jgi:hypothetical protein
MRCSSGCVHDMCDDRRVSSSCRSLTRPGATIPELVPRLLEVREGLCEIHGLRRLVYRRLRFRGHLPRPNSWCCEGVGEMHARSSCLVCSYIVYQRRVDFLEVVVRGSHDAPPPPPFLLAGLRSQVTAGRVVRLACRPRSSWWLYVVTTSDA